MVHRSRRTTRDTGDHSDGRPRTERAAPRLFGLGTETRSLRAVRLSSRCHVGSRARRARRRDARRGGAHEGVPRAARPHRQPPPVADSAGRNFECYSEDPLLVGRIAAAFVRGVQSQGVVTTVKHFAGNDAEFERNTINSVIDERERCASSILVPFELAVREGGALGIMTGYNRLNGAYCSEHDRVARTGSCATSGASKASSSPTGSAPASTVGSADRRASTSRCRGRAASTVPRSPTRCARRGRRSAVVDDHVAAPAHASSTASARSTTRRS